jgi:hypothetical protein
MTEKVEVIRAGVAYNLDRLVAQGVQGITGLLKVPEKRGGNLVIPGRHGELHVPGKKSAPASLVAQLWVRGVNADGTLPGKNDVAARLLFHDNLRELVSLFVEDELVTIRHTLSDGSAREIVGEVTDAVEPDVTGFARHTIGQFAVGLNCAEPFWADVEPSEETVTSTDGIVPLAAFAGASAPMEDLIVTFGEALNPRIAQPATGLHMQYSGLISPGQTLTVDTSDDPVTGWSLASTGGLEWDYRKLEYPQSYTRTTTRWFALKPEPGAPSVQFTHTGLGAATCTIAGRRKYKIA